MPSSKMNEKSLIVISIFRDVGSNDLQPHAKQLLELLLSIDTVNAVAYHSSERGKCNPELTAKLFECASQLLR